MWTGGGGARRGRPLHLPTGCRVTALASDQPRPSWMRRPPLWLAVTLTIAIVIAMATLRLVLFGDKLLPIAYGVPLLVFVWLRHRGLLWFTVASFTVISVVKFFWMLPRSHSAEISAAFRYADFIIIQIDLLIVGSVMHWLVVARERIEQRNAELRLNNAQLESVNRELAGREEEVARQNEELQSQTEELERQSEELRVANAELGRRE